MKAWLRIAAALVALAPAGALGSPQEPFLEAIGRPITAVEVLAPPDEDPQQIVRLSGLVVGEPYRVAQVRRAIQLLFSIGRFQTVRVLARLDEGGVALTLELPPEPRLLETRLADSEVLDLSDVEELLELQVGAALEPSDLRRYERRLEAHLEQLGYREAVASMALDPVDEAGGQVLLVRINEGPLTRLRKVVVRGRPRIPLWQVGRGVGLRPGDVVDLLEVKAGLEALEGRYRSLGYLDVRIEPAVVRPAGRGRADLVLTIRAGPEVRVRVEGNHEVPTRDLRQDLTPLYELGTSPSTLAEVKERLLDRYSKRGFWRAQVEVASRITLDEAKREVLFSIREGGRARVKTLRFPGNRDLDEDDLRDRVWDIVARALSSDLGRPGADPEVVSLALGDRSLSAPRDSPQPDNTAPDPKKVYMPRAYRAASDEIEDLYRARGYQNVDVLEPEVRELDEAGQLLVEIPVKEGLQWRVGALSFSGNEAVEASTLFDKSGLEPASEEGAPLSFAQVEEARQEILSHYRNLGYLYVQMSEELRQVPPRGSLGWDFVRTSTIAPLDVQGVCARAAAAGADHCDVELRFSIDEGVKVSAGAVIVRGLEKTRRGVIEDEVQVRPGTVLSARDLIRTRDNLLRVGVFERVNVRPVDERRMADVKDVLVEVKERRPYSLEVGGGFSTAEGLRAVVGYGDRNLLGTALRLQLQAKLNLFLPPLLLLYDESVRAAVESSYTCNRIDDALFAEDGTVQCVEPFSVLQRLEYEVAMGLSYPRVFGLPDGFSAGLDMIVLRDYDAAYAEDAQRVTLLGNYKYQPDDQVIGAAIDVPINLQLRATFERTNLRCNQALTGRFALCSSDPENAVATQRLEGTNFYLGLGPQVSVDLRDDPFDPRKGLYIELASDAALGLDTGSPNLVSLQGRLNGYVPLASRLTLALAAVFGRIFPLEEIVPDQVEIPINRRYFAGGRSTVRGYAERTLVPQDALLAANGEPQSTISTGGRSMLALKSELRISVYGPVALALFYDIGDLWEGGQFSFETTQTVDGRTYTRTLAHGGGLGLRVATPIGPLALDFAVPFHKRDPIVNDTQLHFSVGAF